MEWIRLPSCQSVVMFPENPDLWVTEEEANHGGQLDWISKFSSPTVFEKSSTPAQDEIEFEIAEVLYGLKKQVSSSDEPLIDDLEKIPVENEENQSISVQGCSVDKASSYYTVKKSKAESISTGPKLGIHNHDKAVIKQETFTAEERSFLCSNLASNGVNLTSEVISATLEETERKQPEKFVIDLNEPPPMESSLNVDDSI